MEHSYFSLACVGSDHRYSIVNGKFASLYFLYDAADTERYHNLMRNKYIFFYCTDNAARLYLRANRNTRSKLPKLGVVNRGEINSALDTVARHLLELCKRTLNSVVNALYKSRTEFDGQRFSRRHDVLAGTETARFLVHLN